MATNRRIQRVNKTLMKEIGDIIMKEIKDPRVMSLVSVLEAKLSNDMRSLRVTVSIYGPKETDNIKTLEALNNASGFISSLASKSLRLRWAPEIIFDRSHSIEESVSMSNKLKDLDKDVEKYEETAEDTDESDQL
jgi:ribosome-binding factor A